MATVREIKDKKAADHKTGMLGLTADCSTVAGKCLTCEQMAVLVEKKCSQQKEKEFLKHIACCRSCYDEWLTLRKQVVNNKAQQEKKSKTALLSFVSKPKILAVFGSTLAAAASVVFVLNIYFDQQLITSKEEGKSVFEVKEKDAVDTKEVRKSDTYQPQKQTTVLKKVEMPEASSPKPVVVGGRVRNRAPSKQVAVDKEAVDLAVERKKVKALGKEVAREKSIRTQENKSHLASRKLPKSRMMAEKVMSDEMVLSQTKIGKPTIDKWLQQVKRGCVDNQRSVMSWQQLARSGKKLRVLHSLEMQSDERFTKVLNRVMEIKVENLDRICTEILQIMEEKEINTNQ